MNAPEPEKTYSVEEANALLPYLAPTLVELRDKLPQAVEIKQAIPRIAMGNGHSPEREQWSRTLARVDELLERIQGWEVLLRDVDSGLVDFPTVMQGREAFLCWRLGEPDVAYWHFPEDGFAGRTPL
jgi:hypothetical protein